jgi:hypothetical protein
MAAMTNFRRAPSVRRVARRCAALTAALAAVLASSLLATGCSTGDPPPLPQSALALAQVFPYYRIYWVGPTFGAYPLTAVDGLKSYNPSIGDSVFYGDCVRKPSVLGGGSCLLPLQVTTVVYRLHSNRALGPQRNTVIRGVPAVIYDEGRSIELYSGRQAIDVFSDSLAPGLRAAQALLPLNAPGSATGPLPRPVYCPGLSGPQSRQVRAAMANLPGHACQQAHAVEALNQRLSK